MGAAGERKWRESALAEIARLRAENAQLVAANQALVTREAEAREPDFCHDAEWEWTMTWGNRDELVEGCALGTITAIETLFIGPTYYTVERYSEADDEYQRKWFSTEEEASAFLAGKAGA